MFLRKTTVKLMREKIEFIELTLSSWASAMINEEVIKTQRNNEFTSNYHINIENIKIIGFFDEITKKALT